MIQYILLNLSACGNLSISMNLSKYLKKRKVYYILYVNKRRNIVMFFIILQYAFCFVFGKPYKSPKVLLTIHSGVDHDFSIIILKLTIQPNSNVSSDG